MTLYEVHQALAQALGDPFKETALATSTIYDGVRYSATARQRYLYRAACSVINEIVKQIAPLPREVAAAAVWQILPSMISQLSDQIYDAVTKTTNFYSTPINEYSLRIAYIIAAKVSTPLLGYGDYIPIAIVSPWHGSRIASGAGHAQKNDPICWISYTLVHSGSPDRSFFVTLHQGSKDFTGGQFDISFLRYPQNQALSDGTVAFDFEDSFINTILSKATIYGMTDGGDLTPQEVLPLLIS